MSRSRNFAKAVACRILVAVMCNRFISYGICVLFFAGLLLATPSPADAQTLYDGSLGTLPENQGWSYLALFGPASKTLTDNSVLFDTTASTGTEAGWSGITQADLNRTRGFTLLVTAKLNAETHASTNRAGFSIIVLGDDTNGIELAFWTNTIFAQTDSPLFTHGEDVSFNTTNGYVNYALTMLKTNYVLRANGNVILTGTARNYSAFVGLINPYSTPDFLFFGDDTSSAGALVNVRNVTLVLPPTLSMPVPGVLSWTGVSNQTYTVQTSSNLTAWSNAGTATSTSNLFSFTNSMVSSGQFFRVVYP